jgi:uncharacterized transporter YbjL
LLFFIVSVPAENALPALVVVAEKPPAPKVLGMTTVAITDTPAAAATARAFFEEMKPMSSAPAPHEK